jgi:hypothetical protein
MAARGLWRNPGFFSFASSSHVGDPFACTGGNVDVPDVSNNVQLGELQFIGERSNDLGTGS